jgi:hypothetical protein
MSIGFQGEEKANKLTHTYIPVLGSQQPTEKDLFRERKRILL